MDYRKILKESEHLSASHKKDLPWSAANSLWHSSYAFPLAHTTLRAYLPPEKERRLLNELPKEKLERQFYAEAVKISHNQGLIDSTALNTFIIQSRSVPAPPAASLDKVISNDAPTQASPRRCRRGINGACITSSGAQYDIFNPPPFGEPSAPLELSSPSSSRHPPTEVSSKIGANLLRKPQRRRQQEICSKIGSQAASEKPGGSCTSRPSSVAVTTPRSQRNAWPAVEATVQRIQTPAVRSSAAYQASAVAPADRPAKAATLTLPVRELTGQSKAATGVTTSTDKESALQPLPLPPGQLGSLQDKTWLANLTNRRLRGENATGTASYVPLDSKHLPWPRLHNDNS